MFDLPFDFFALLIAVVAFIFARKAFNQADMLRARLDAMEATGLRARPRPPPLTAFEGIEQTPAAASPGIAAEQAEAIAGAEPVAPAADDQDAASKDADGATAATPPPLPQPEPGFEERIGTRWVVWVGGLTLALGTLAAALLHGPALAGLGIAAAFVTPVLVSSEKPDFWALYIYLAIVTAAAFGLARIRLWRWLAVTTIAFALLWTFPCLQCGPSMVAPHAFHVMSGFVLAALLVVCGFMFGPPADEGQIEPISSGSLAAYLFGATMIVLASSHADTAIIVFALLVAGTLFVAWRAQAATGAVAAAAIFVFAVFAEWAVRGNPDMLVLPGGPLPGIGPAATDSSVALHLIAAAIFAVGFGAAGFLAQGRSIGAIIPVVWSASAVFTPLALLIALYARIAHLDRSIPFAILAVILAAAYGAATEALTRRDSRPGLPISIALFATGALGALALALTFALEKGWLTIALALMSLAAAWISMQRPIPFLRSLAAILAGIVVLRIGYEPRIAGAAVGQVPIFNWLLWGYGIPALSFWIASQFMRRRRDDAPLRAVEGAAILFTVLLAFMEI